MEAKSIKQAKQLVIIGNGFDLAHGLKTSYKDFLDWYMCRALEQFCRTNSYGDSLIEIKNDFVGKSHTWDEGIKNFQKVINTISSSRYISIDYNSNFFKKILDSFGVDKWVDIECYYFTLLKTYFLHAGYVDKEKFVTKLNTDLDCIVTQLELYIATINSGMGDMPRLEMNLSDFNLYKLFAENQSTEIKYLNFNYTDTLIRKYFMNQDDIIHIHGKVSDSNKNPIIFGYGDETDPAYQKIEDSGENMYLEHIKSFGYFRTDNYHKLLSYIDSSPFTAHIVGHSCGLSDRVLLNEIFEHSNCQSIEIFYHVFGTKRDNFKEITQEISRHFKPHNKNLMRRKILDKNSKNMIPQHSHK